MRLPFGAARSLAALCEMEAAAMGVPMAVALADEEGAPLFFGRMDGTLPVSTELASGKACTAAALRLATDEVGRLSQPGGPLYGLQHTHGGRIVLFGGGMPLHVGGRVIGAVGVSGGTVSEDMAVAQAAVSALSEMARISEVLAELFHVEHLEGPLIVEAALSSVLALAGVSARALHIARGAVHLAVAMKRS